MTEIWRTLGPELKKHSKRLALVIFLGILISGLKSLTPYLISQLPGVWDSGDHEKALWIPVIIAAAWILASILNYFHVFWGLFISELVAVNLRRQLLNKYLTLNLSFFSGFLRGSGGLISRMLNDITIVQSGFQKIADLVREPFTAVIMLGYLLVTNFKLTLFICIGLPIIATVLRRLARSVRKYSKQNQESMEDLTQVIKESLDGTRIVQSFNLQDEMRRRFETQTTDFLKSKAKIISREELAGPISEGVSSLFGGMLLFYVGQLIFKHEFTTGEFLGFTTSVVMIQDSIRRIQAGYIKLQQSAVALERMRGILDSTSVVPEAPGARPFPAQWNEIEFQNVSFKYDNAPEAPVLKKVNLTIRRGERIALVGSSGAGKSTLINLLPRFFDPTEGRILIGGTPISQMSLTDLRANVALVSQDVFLFSDTVEKNIHSGDFSKNPSGIEEAARLANADNFIRAASGGYKARVGDRGSLFSGGEKQRISIARAIFKNAPILILDEATSALDSESEQEVQKGLEHLMEGRTALIIAHRLSTISQCDRIIVMDKGEIVEQGDHQALLAKNGAYNRFYQLQSRI